MSDYASIMQTLLDGLRDIQITRYTELASTTIIVFEHLITFNDEIDLVWGSAWSLGKVLFLLNRYYTLAAGTFNTYSFFSSSLTDSTHSYYHSCVRLFQWQAWTGLVGWMLAEGIFQIRIYALYSLNKKILALLLVCFLGSIGTSAWIAANSLRASAFSATAVSIPHGKFCVPFGVSPHFYTFWIPMLSFETLLCTLAVIKGFQAFKSNGSLFHRGQQLVGILVRDSLMYFLIICITYLTCLIFWITAPTTLLEVPVGFTVSMSCVLANRVVLNVREVSRDIDSKLPTSQNAVSRVGYDTSFCSPGTLSDFEMEQLRTMRVERHWSEVIPEYYDDNPPFTVL